jgi:UDPglucose 6-dehydrogenase
MIGIIGIGYVGGAIVNCLETFGLEYRAYDKYKNIGGIEEILKCDFVFLCLPTPLGVKGYDLSSLEESCEKLKGYKGLVLVKSTVEPEVCEYLANKYDLRIIHNPEFLSANTANQDFLNQWHVVLGKTTLAGDITKVTDFYEKYFPHAEISVVKSGESEAMKLFCNTFYAVKVQMFTEFYTLCKSDNLDYNTVKSLMLRNGWINPMHTVVPGPDGRISYGGSCLPKDAKALLEYMKQKGSYYNVLEACVLERDEMRGE